MPHTLKGKIVLPFLVIISLFFSACTKDVGGGTGNNTGGGTGGGNNNTPPTVTTPSTTFQSFQNYTVSGFGAYNLIPFTINGNTNFVLRFTSRYKSQAAVISSGQLANFENMGAFNGYGIFDNQVGTKNITLGAGDYYVGVRNTSSSDNEWSLELDYATSLPASDRCTFVDNYIQGAQTFTSGGIFYQAFTIQKGYRYFMDGCNVGYETYIIADNQIDAFKNNQAFSYYSDYASTTGAGPGFFEITLPAGSYYFVARGPQSGSLTYTMERWKVN